MRWSRQGKCVAEIELSSRSGNCTFKEISGVEKCACNDKGMKYELVNHIDVECGPTKPQVGSK